MRDLGRVTYVIALGSILVGVAWAASALSHDWTDVMNVRHSPDGQFTAAYVADAHGPIAAVVFGITLSRGKSDPRDGMTVLKAEQDYRDLDYRWETTGTLSFGCPVASGAA